MHSIRNGKSGDGKWKTDRSGISASRNRRFQFDRFDDRGSPTTHGRLSEKSATIHWRREQEVSVVTTSWKTRRCEKWKESLAVLYTHWQHGVFRSLLNIVSRIAKRQLDVKFSFSKAELACKTDEELIRAITDSLGSSTCPLSLTNCIPENHVLNFISILQP